MAAPQIGMPKADLRRLLNFAKKDPVNCAIGQGPEPAFGLIMLDKIKQPRAVEKLLTAAIPAAKNTRWGTAWIDTDADPKLVKLTLNRACSGMARRLAKSLKGTGVNKVLIVLDDGTEIERHEEAEEEDEAEDAEQADTASSSDPQPRPDLDKRALEQRLAGMIPRIQGHADAGLKAELSKLAGAVISQLKSGDLETAAQTIDDIAARLDRGISANGDASAGAGVKLAKGLLLWNGTRAYAEKQLQQLTDAVLAQSAGESDFKEIEAATGRINGLLELMDDRLLAKLGELQSATDSSKKAELSKQARALVEECQARVGADPLMAAIDQNGFIPMDVNAKVTSTLDAMLKII